MTSITLRKATSADFQHVLAVEKKSTPGLQYLPQVYDQFLADERGEFTVAEIEGEIVACAKFSVLPDNSAWLETIRVTPERQGLGIGKRFYENYHAIAAREGVSAMRMYTGIGNAVSKGLAEWSGLSLAETFDEYVRPVDSWEDESTGIFRPNTNPTKVTDLIMPHAEAWGGWLVMNRTFYKLTPPLCEHLAERGFVYSEGESILIAGARFMPESALHIGLVAGNTDACLKLAAHLATLVSAPRIVCAFPSRVNHHGATLQQAGYTPGRSQLIVMEK